jgi:hypothetical protein
MLRKHQFGAYAVGSGDKNGFIVSTGWQRKQATEAANASQDLGAPCSCDERLDALDQFIASIDIDASIFVR